ncbi:hypothetical protein ACFLQ1_02045 [Candidatus Auribacterota bacterium]
MIRILFSFLILFLGFFFQQLSPPYLMIQGIKGDLLLVIVIYFSLKYGWKWGICFGIVAGILQDAFFLLGILVLSP